MQRLFLFAISLVAMSGCASQPSPPPSAAAPSAVQPVSYAAGSPANTTNAFDGTYTAVAAQNMSAGNTLAVAGEAGTNCPSYQLTQPVTISNGLAQFQGLNLTFQGYVTPQGALAMRSGVGQHFEGQIDNQNVLRGRFVGACAYDAAWRRSA